MKKLLIVNNNMKVGGVQKSLCNLLWSLDPAQYDVTLLLFAKTGPYMKNIPDTVRVIECGGPFRFLGKSQSEHKGREKLVRGLLATVSRLLGRDSAIRWMLLKQPELDGQYDCAVSFLQNGRPEAFYGGTQDYVLYRVKAQRKVAWLHCDYQNCGANHDKNNRMLEKFDNVVACSDGCRRSFLEAMPHLEERCLTIPNCHRIKEILDLADDDPIVYSKDSINVLMVARLTHEKGLERTLKAVSKAKGDGLAVHLHLVGDGPLRESLQTIAEQWHIQGSVTFYGEQANPYRYMKNADVLLVSSYHEAAPMVIDEALCLGLPVMSTATTSTQEMIVERGAGWVCDNHDEALTEMLCRVLADPKGVAAVRTHLEQTRMDNSPALARFATVVNGETATI